MVLAFNINPLLKKKYKENIKIDLCLDMIALERKKEADDKAAMERERSTVEQSRWRIAAMKREKGTIEKEL